MSTASIVTCVRVRPFSQRTGASLGVVLHEGAGDKKGNLLQLVNEKLGGDHSFSCTHGWWSAPDPAHFLEAAEDKRLVEEIPGGIVQQAGVYAAVGEQMRADVLHGDPVVLFAYGLSGSGKTYTVFGPDDPRDRNAWYRFAEPHSQWGLFPRLAFELFAVAADKEKQIQVSMQYFQNIDSSVRDLLSPVGECNNYKKGMTPDKDGFMQVSWCTTKRLTDFDDLRATIARASKSKEISPTQYNRSSTRGHCILVLNVDMPHPELADTRQRGRIYVCDLAGTEKATEVYVGEEQEGGAGGAQKGEQRMRRPWQCSAQCVVCVCGVVCRVCGCTLVYGIHPSAAVTHTKQGNILPHSLLHPLLLPLLQPLLQPQVLCDVQENAERSGLPQSKRIPL